MAWRVDLSAEVEKFLNDLTEEEFERVDACISLLVEFGPNLPRPHSGEIKGSKHHSMKELRIRYGDEHFRVLYAFDPLRRAYLMVAADKALYDFDGFYTKFIPIADDMFDKRIAESMTLKDAKAKKTKATQAKAGKKGKKG